MAQVSVNLNQSGPQAGLIPSALGGLALIAVSTVLQSTLALLMHSELFSLILMLRK